MPLTLSLHSFSTAGFLLTQDPARKHYSVVDSPNIKGSDSMTEEFNDMFCVFFFFFFNHLMQWEPWMLMGKRKPQPTRDSDLGKTRQVGQDLGSGLQNRSAEERPPLEGKQGVRGDGLQRG